MREYGYDLGMPLCVVSFITRAGWKFCPSALDHRTKIDIRSIWCSLKNENKLAILQNKISAKCDIAKQFLKSLALNLDAECYWLVRSNFRRNNFGFTKFGKRKSNTFLVGFSRCLVSRVMFTHCLELWCWWFMKIVSLTLNIWYNLC